MKFTAKELTRILNQPGYGIADGSLIDPLAAHSGPEGVLQTDGASSNQTDVRGRQRASRAARWRNEWEFQRAVVNACELMAVAQPEYGLIFHVANENAHRQPGVKAGVMDLCWPIARGKYHSCWVELKIGSGKLSRVQQVMKRRFEAEGNFVAVVWDDVSQVMSVLEWYLSLGKTGIR